MGTEVGREWGGAVACFDGKIKGDDVYLFPLESMTFPSTRGAPLRAFFVLISTLGGSFAFAVPVLKVDGAQTMVAVSHGAKRKWKVGEYLCVRKHGQDIACGPVSKTTLKGAIVKFDYQTGDEISVGDDVVFKRGAAVSGYVSEPGGAPSRVPSDIRADSVERDLRRLQDDRPAAASAQRPARSDESVSELTEEFQRGEIRKKSSSGSASDRVRRDSIEVADESGSGEEKEVDLEEDAKESAGAASVHGGMTVSKPKFRTMFDWWITHQPGRDPANGTITFNNYHTLLIMELQPDPNIYFGFEVTTNLNPRFFELDWTFQKIFTVRLGRIYIPFDDLSPHTYFGGRVNVAQMSQNAPGSAFLPDLFTDLGVGLKVALYDDKETAFELNGYMVNGFQEGGTSPGTDTAYPDFSQTFLKDNNSNKALGARAQLSLMKEMFIFGASVYTGRYTADTSESASILMAGVDGKMRYSGSEIRGGYAFMNVGVLPTDSFVRGAFYLEFAQWFGKWRALARVGQSQNDSRAIQITDQTVVGGSIAYRPSPVAMFSLEHSRDINDVAGKSYFSFTGLRLSVML